MGGVSTGLSSVSNTNYPKTIIQLTLGKTTNSSWFVGHFNAGDFSSGSRQIRVLPHQRAAQGDLLPPVAGFGSFWFSANLPSKLWLWDTEFISIPWTQTTQSHGMTTAQVFLFTLIWLVVWTPLKKILVRGKDNPIYYGGKTPCLKPPTSGK